MAIFPISTFTICSYLVTRPYKQLTARYRRFTTPANGDTNLFAGGLDADPQRQRSDGRFSGASATGEESKSGP